MPEIISLSNNSEYKGKIDIHFIADKFSNKIPDFIQKRGELWWFLQHNSVLDIEKKYYISMPKRTQNSLNNTPI